jgi:hypothetical protein
MRRAIGYFISAFFAIGTLPENAAADSRYTGIQEVWQEFYLHHSVNEKLSTQLLFNNLYHDEWGNYDWFAEAGLKYKLKPWLAVEGMYRQEYFRVEGSWQKEYRPMLRLSTRTKLGRWHVRNRQRLELRMFDQYPTGLRFRSDIRIKPDWSFTTLNISPFVSEEVFVSKGRLSRVRSYAGFMASRGRFAPMAYLVMQSDEGTSYWQHRLIFGIGLGIEL